MMFGIGELLIVLLITLFLLIVPIGTLIFSILIYLRIQRLEQLLEKKPQ